MNPKLCQKVSHALKKASPTILTCIGAVGVVATTVLAVKATPKALELVKADSRKNHDGDPHAATKAEVVKSCWKCYIPAAVTGTLSVACLIGASSVSLKRNAALATAYTISETALKDYREKAVEVVGEKKAQAIQDAVTKDKIAKDPVEGKEIIMTGTDDVLCYDVLSGRYFKSSQEKINRAVNEVNRNMRTEMYVSLNDFYYEIGLDGIGLGEHLGWNIEKGYMDVQFGSHLASNGTPCLVISYSVAPQYGYDILTLR